MNKKNEPAVEDGTMFYTNARGFKVTLRGIPPLEVPLLYNAIEQPPIPTYTVEIAGGGTQTFNHEVDEEKGVNTLIVDDPEETAENQKKWAEYTNARLAAENALATSISDAALIDGIDIDQDALKAEYPRWQKRMQLKGIKVPDDPDEKELMFKRTFVVADKADLKKIIQLVMELTGVNQEVIEQTKASFPDSVEPTA